MKIAFGLSLVTLAALLMTAGAAVADDPRTPSPSHPRNSLGLGIVSAPTPYRDAENRILPIPLVELYYKRLYVQGIRAGFRVLGDDGLHLDLRVRWSFLELDPDDSPFLEGMNPRKPTALGGLALEWNRDKLQISGSLLTDLLGRSGGLAGSLLARWHEPLMDGRLTLIPSLGVAYQDTKTIDYYFGVTPNEATEERPVYRGTAAWNPTARLIALFKITPRLNLVAQLAGQSLDNEIRNSPIVDDSWGYEAVLGITYSLSKQ